MLRNKNRRGYVAFIRIGPRRRMIVAGSVDTLTLVNCIAVAQEVPSVVDFKFDRYLLNFVANINGPAVAYEWAFIRCF